MSWDSLPSGVMPLWCALCGTVQDVTVPMGNAMDSRNTTRHTGQLNGNATFTCTNCAANNSLNMTLYAEESA